jgi:hypothetical protein
VRLETTATTYHSKIIETHVVGLYSHLGIYISMYLCICLCMWHWNYPFTHSIPGLLVGDAWEQFNVYLKMTIEWTQRSTSRLLSSLIGDAPVEHNHVNLVGMIKQASRYTRKAIIIPTGSPYSSKFADTHWWHHWVNFEMCSEFIIEPVCSFTRRPYTSELWRPK